MRRFAVALFIELVVACGGGEKTVSAPMQEVVVAMSDGGDAPIATIATADDAHAPKKHADARAAPTATAVPPPPIPPGSDPRTEARKRFQQGAILYSQGDYARAVAEFEAAYAFAPAPAVLFNIGICYEHLGRDQDALTAYERYEQAMSSSSSPSPNVADVHKRIAALRAKLGRP
jgi:tetratricopeptide (TPR) repeat protein